MLFIYFLQTQRSWIERVFHKRECIAYIPSQKDKSK